MAPPTSAARSLRCRTTGLDPGVGTKPRSGPAGSVRTLSQSTVVSVPVPSADGPATGSPIAVHTMYATAIADGADPAAALWPTSARWVHELRIRGLSALLDLSAEQTLDFFDAFFTIPIDVQRS